MSIKVDITSKVLFWARDTSGFSQAEIAEKFKRKGVTPETIAAWEAGLQQPTYAQLSQLAEYYKRPIALFFFPNPPQENTIEEDFRHLPSNTAKEIPPTIRHLVRKAKARQIDLEELYSGVSHKPRVTDLKAKEEEIQEALVKRIRAQIGVSISDQTEWRNYDEAFKGWRTAVEKLGVWVFKEAFNDDNYCGFCIYHKQFPIIYINNSEPPQRQIFTLFHELGHLLRGKAGIGFRSAPKQPEKYQREEVFCNAFAGVFLVPESELKHFSSLPNDEKIEEIARHYKVSYEVILRRFLFKNFISETGYNQKIETRKSPSKSGNTSGGNYYNNQQAYLGRKYMELVFRKFHQQQIDRQQLADYLDVKVGYVTALEDTFHSLA